MARSDGERARAAELKDRLLREAAEVIRKGGIESLSMRKVAASLSYTTTTIYYHFGSRNALVAGVRDLAWEQLHAVLCEARTAESWTQRAVDMAVAYLSFAVEEPSLYHVCFLAGAQFREAVSGVGPEDEARDSGERRAYALFEEHIQEGMDEGRVPFQDGRRAALHYWSWSHGLASLLADGTIPLPSDSFARSQALRSLAIEFLGQFASIGDGGTTRAEQ